MNPTTEPPPASLSAAGTVDPLLPPQPPQAHRLSTSCDRHPDESFTGFCPSCLCERLAGLDNKNDAQSSSSSRKQPITAAVLKAIFKPSSSGNSAVSSNGGWVRPGFLSELRRTKSFSASKNNTELGIFSGGFEPQRRSCDVRVRSTLWNLFSDEQRKELESKIETEPRKSSVREEPVFESKEEGKSESETEISDHHENGGDHEIEILNEPSDAVEERTEEIVEEEEEDLKPMKDHIDLDSQAKKPSVKGSFWSAASGFSKKLQKWRLKQKMKKHRNGGGGSARLPVEKPIGRQYRDTQSEIADYGFGRRSCDTDPRFSLDAGRFSLDAGRFSVDASRFSTDASRFSIDGGRFSTDAGRVSVDAGRFSVDAGRVSVDAGRFSVDAGRVSVDDPRYSFDEPRASWDGYLIGRTGLPPRPSMLSVVEDAPPHAPRMTGSDIHIPVEESTPPPPPPATANDSEVAVPGGSAQTRDFYTDSGSRRRKSLDRSSSIRRSSFSTAAEMEEPRKLSPNAKVSPAIPAESLSNHLRDDCSVENFETASVINGERRAILNNNLNNAKKSRRWSKWSILGFIHRKSISKYEEEEEDERFSRSNGVIGVERSLSESWPELRGGGRNINPKMMRSNSNVSWRSTGFFGGNPIRQNGGSVLERNRSSRYSPKEGENGMLRFYLTPGGGNGGGGGGGGRRGIGGGAWEKTAARANSHGHSIARSVMRLY